MTPRKPAASSWPLDEQPLGPREVADLLKVKRQTVQQWMFRELLPDRDATVSGQPAWKRATILAWAADTGRLPAGQRVPA